MTPAPVAVADSDGLRATKLLFHPVRQLLRPQIIEHQHIARLIALHQGMIAFALFLLRRVIARAQLSQKIWHRHQSHHLALGHPALGQAPHQRKPQRGLAHTHFSQQHQPLLIRALLSKRPHLRERLRRRQRLQRQHHAAWQHPRRKGGDALLQHPPLPGHLFSTHLVIPALHPCLLCQPGWAGTILVASPKDVPGNASVPTLLARHQTQHRPEAAPTPTRPLRGCLAQVRGCSRQACSPPRRCRAGSCWSVLLVLHGWFPFAAGPAPAGSDNPTDRRQCGWLLPRECAPPTTPHPTAWRVRRCGHSSPVPGTRQCVREPAARGALRALSLARAAPTGSSPDPFALTPGVAASMPPDRLMALERRGGSSATEVGALCVSSLFDKSSGLSEEALCASETTGGVSVSFFRNLFL